MRSSRLAIALLVLGAIGAACGGGVANNSNGGDSQGSSGSGGPGSGGAGSSGAGYGGGLNLGGDSSTGSYGDGGSTGAGDTCATESAEADLEPVYLAFAFDVSGSMGMGDEPWHDKSLKWDPVVAATKQFFMDPLSKGVMASLTFFPDESTERNEDDVKVKCTAAPYEEPYVSMRPLPSPDFGAAIDEITPTTEDEWRGDTPTVGVMQGTISLVERLREETPGKYAIVLVTDGYPAGCGSRLNQISAVVTEVQAALESDIPTYVIGVENPPLEGAPDTLEDLNDIAAAGGTEHAFLIDTGNPSQTTASFKAAIDAIRGATVSCTIAIPPAPSGREFDEEKVRVTYKSGDGAPTALRYDQDCETEGAWRYDSTDAPTQIVLCDSTCAAIQADPEAALAVDFTCERVINIPR